MLDKVLKIGLLYDFYGALLTDKQQRCMEMHYLHDLSLGEIADEFKVSRQAVNDILRRGEQVLEEIESKLRLVDRYNLEQQTINKVYDIVTGLPANLRQSPEVTEVIELLKQLINREEEV